MDADKAELVWAKAVMRYQRRQGLEALRAMLREQEPPIPPEMVVSPEVVLWFKTISTPPPLEGLDRFTQTLEGLDRLTDPAKRRR
jgi:hypothetical protein